MVQSWEVPRHGFFLELWTGEPVEFLALATSWQLPRPCLSVCMLTHSRAVRTVALFSLLLPESFAGEGKGGGGAVVLSGPWGWFPSKSALSLSPSLRD